MKRILVPFLLLIVCISAFGRHAHAAPLPNPFTDLRGYVKAVTMAVTADPVEVVVRNYSPDNDLFITSVGGFADFQIPYALGLGDTYSGYFTSRSDTLSMTFSGSGSADAVIYMHSGEVLRTPVGAGTYYFDVSIYPFPDAWIAMHLEAPLP